MSTYYSLGCERCREEQKFLRDGMAGFGWMASADRQVPQFVEKHQRMGCLEFLRVFSEHDWRYDEFAEFDPKTPWDVPPG